MATTTTAQLPNAPARPRLRGRERARDAASDQSVSTRMAVLEARFEQAPSSRWLWASMLAIVSAFVGLISFFEVRMGELGRRSSQVETRVVRVELTQ